jgi:hypothetical protein
VLALGSVQLLRHLHHRSRERTVQAVRIRPSITIQQIGVTGTATPDQVRARWREVAGGGA